MLFPWWNQWRPTSSVSTCRYFCRVEVTDLYVSSHVSHLWFMLSCLANEGTCLFRPRPKFFRLGIKFCLWGRNWQLSNHVLFFEVDCPYIFNVNTWCGIMNENIKKVYQFYFVLLEDICIFSVTGIFNNWIILYPALIHCSCCWWHWHK